MGTFRRYIPESEVEALKGTDTKGSKRAGTETSRRQGERLVPRPSRLYKNRLFGTIWGIMRILVLSVILALFTSCAHKASPGPATETALPRFSLTGADLASPVELATNTIGRAGSIELRIKLSPSKADELREFTQAHLNENVELVAGSIVIMRALVRDPIAGGQFKVSFAPYDTSALAIADFLNKK
jgi:hypothetical protein